MQILLNLNLQYLTILVLYARRMYTICTISLSSLYEVTQMILKEICTELKFSH